MNLAMILTVGRIALAPIFFLLYEMAERSSAALLYAAWGVFAVMEITDLLDGFVARRFGQESELGKVLDPCADSLSRLTYFVALAGSGILPLWILIILVYRDVSVAYIRVMVSQRKVLMPARLSGKLKAWIYAFAGIAGMARFSAGKLAWAVSSTAALQHVALGFFLLSAAVALWSLVDYAGFFIKIHAKTS